MVSLATRHEHDASASPRRRFLVLLCLGVTVVRASYVPHPLRNDEGGYLLIARQWHAGGEFLYGDYFVDRPPLLMLIVRMASLTDWDQAIRVIAIPFVLLFVVAGWRAGMLLGGPTGGRWAALVAAGVMCSPALGAEQAEGELFGAVLVMGSIALALSAWHTDATVPRAWWAAAAGGVAAAAPLVKQNLLEGGVFLASLVVVASLGRGEAARGRARVVAPAAALGALIPAAAVWVWLASTGTGAGLAWRDLVSFRGSALAVIWSTAPDATLTRGWQLLALGVVTGLVPVVVVGMLAARSGLPRVTPERRAIVALVLFGMAAIAAGGSYWPPYLLQLAPAAVLAAGAIAPLATRSGRWMRTASLIVMAAAVVGTVAAVVVPTVVPAAESTRGMGNWLAGSKLPGDTAVVAYGLPSVLEAADLGSPYPYLWSVPMRTLDPEQDRLRATLAGGDAPVWVVQVTGLNAWGIDEGSRLRDLLRQRYRVVAEICGHPVWLRQGLTREPAAPPPC